MPVLHVCHEVSFWPNKRAWEQIVDIWPILLEFGPINDLLLFVTGRRWCRSLAKVTKRVKIEKSKLVFVIPKTISVIPYPYKFLVSYPLSLKLFCHLSLIPKSPNRASWLLQYVVYLPKICFHPQNRCAVANICQKCRSPPPMNIRKYIFSTWFYGNVSSAGYR